jgi:hypothetical protein
MPNTIDALMLSSVPSGGMRFSSVIESPNTIGLPLLNNFFYGNIIVSEEMRSVRTPISSVHGKHTLAGAPGPVMVGAFESRNMLQVNFKYLSERFEHSYNAAGCPKICIAKSHRSVACPIRMPS